MRAVSRALGAAALVLAAALTAAFAAAVLWTVVSRYGLGRTPIWAEELPRLLLVWAAFLGAGAAEARGGHLAAGLTGLVVRNPRALAAIGRLRDLAVIAFAVLAVRATVDLVAIAGSGTSTALALPASAFYWSAAVGLALIGLAAAARLLSRDG